MSGTRALGIALFLPVPVVLVLFTRQPLGALQSLVAGAAIMVTHGLYARPWALHHAARRCLWCGRSAQSEPIRPGTETAPSVQTTGKPEPDESLGEAKPTSAGSFLRVQDPRGAVSWTHCHPEHRAGSQRTLAFAWRHRRFLRVGILGTLILFLAGGAAVTLSSLDAIPMGDLVNVFRLGVAVTVLPLGWLGSRIRSTADSDEREWLAPFPLHIASLIGIQAVLWLFRWIGIFWLGQGAVHFLRRLG